MKHPQSKRTICIACNQLFFSHSLRFHQKQCFQKHAYEKYECPKCHESVRIGVYQGHQEVCSQQPDQIEQDLTDNVPIGQIEADGRISCGICQRGFAPDRIRKHQSVCKGKSVVTVRSNNLQLPTNPTRHKAFTNRFNASRKPVKKRSGNLQRSVPKPIAPSNGVVLPEKRHPYDFVLREFSNRPGWGGSSRQIHGSSSNASSNENPLATNEYMKMIH